MTDPHVLDPDHLPTPFTADEIRAGNPAGREIRIRVERTGAEAVTRVSRYVETDDEGALQEFSVFDASGTPVGEPQRRRSTWLQLQEHASFPIGQATVARETIRTPLGTLDCLRYTVTDGDDVDTFWFAEGYAGMPIRIESRTGGGLTSTVNVESSRVDG